MLQELSNLFNEKSNDINASKQAAYMKNRFKFFGLNAAARREIQKEVFKAHPIDSEEKLIKTAFSLYGQSEREFHYAAIDLCQKYRRLVSKMIFIEKLIITHSWWDSVDLLASNLLGFFFQQNPKEMKVLHEWIGSENLWKRRSALIFQLKWKEKTDIDRLFQSCLYCGGEREFFIEKAIGWALREFSKTNPRRVKQFIFENEGVFSSFTKKEACKLIS